MGSHLHLLDKFPRAVFDGMGPHSLTLPFSFLVYAYAFVYVIYTVGICPEKGGVAEGVAHWNGI